MITSNTSIKCLMAIAVCAAQALIAPARNGGILGRLILCPFLAIKA
jgi:hypothetical protein